MGHNSRSSNTGTCSLFLDFHATLIFDLYTLLSFEKILRVAAEEGAVDSNFLALVIAPLDRLIGVESDVTPVQTRELFIVVEIILTLDHGGELLGLAFPFDSHDALDEARAARNEGFNEVLHCPFAWECLRGEVAGGKCAAEAGGFVEVDVVKAREMGAVAEAVFALILVASLYIIRAEPRPRYGSKKKLTEKSRRFEKIGSALFILGVAWVANDEVHREDFWVEAKVVIQLGGEKSLVGLASAEALVLDVIDDDGGVVVDFVKDRLVKIHCGDVDPQTSSRSVA